MENLFKAQIISPKQFEDFVINGMTYTTYFNLMNDEIKNHARFNEEDALSAYIPLNITRMQRVEKLFELNEKLQNALQNLTQNYTWLIITEFWCGDAAQNIPALNQIAEASNKKINVKLVFRDDNIDLMDQFLTNGSRSIPKLICLNQNNQVQYTWGPRPAEAQELVISLKANPETKDTYAEKVHLWYARNRSQALQNEILNLVQS